MENKKNRYSLNLYPPNVARDLEFEFEVFDFLDSLPPGSVLYDLGACVGGFALYACCCNLKVIAFEVDEVNYNGMLHNYESNKNILPKNHYFKPIQIGVADKKGKCILRIGQPEVGGHHKTLNLEDYSASTIIVGPLTREVEINSLDNIIEENQFPYPDFLKIDIDGSEHAFINGAKNSLSKCKGLIIELQIDHELYDDIVEKLNSFGLKETFRSKRDLGVSNLFNIIFLRDEQLD